MCVTYIEIFGDLGKWDLEIRPLFRGFFFIIWSVLYSEVPLYVRTYY